jgi:hypothetical protein
VVSETTGPVIEGDIAIVAATPSVVATAEFDAKELSNAIVATGSYGCVQLWGDVDRSVLESAGIILMPEVEPRSGHQGIPMTAAGHEAVVRLQVGGLAAVRHRFASPGSPFFGLAQPLQPLDRSTM